MSPDQVHLFGGLPRHQDSLTARCLVFGGAPLVLRTVFRAPCRSLRYHSIRERLTCPGSCWFEPWQSRR